jgi:uncharacterized protein YbjT (DUF2867 family)
MKLLILGATGRTGRLVVSEALKRGHAVHAVVRDAARLPVSSEKLAVFEGTPSDEETLRKAMEGCDAIVNTLNISRVSDFPWSPLRTPEDFLSRTIAKVIRIAGELGVRRIIVTSAFGVHETKAYLPGWFRWFIDHSNIGAAYRDHERQEDLLRTSSLDWTIVRPVGLTNSKREQKVMVSKIADPQPTLTISRLAVARFLLDVVEQRAFVRQIVTVSKQRVARLKARHFAEKASGEMDKLWDERGWTNKTMDEWLKDDSEK